ncbi:SusC/RagA family TonB-linked outer membrane protein [Chryseosolibacter indicus]|uniref:SusC/RagA family TonB-linked outer membrane protein n=1 Tax=Chryseosolibacter indicus TaxID=2782351 RepID=A0ABS5VSP3_9BACT|nr:SusC/RagA family TonB-linked outer membrane protein [Chryseosolibacter indicus]MBT1704455.1 SusC/RagA family TonB-linked outer membrane protein [Chryseosolibacter indicus]
MKKIFTEKLWKLMRICATQGLFAVLICGVSIAFDNHGQVLDREISITVSEVSFDLALIEIANAAHVKFAYSPELLNVKDPISLNVENMTVREILNNLLLPKQISYVVQRDSVTISLKRIPKQKITLNNTDSLTETDRSLNTTLTGIVIDVASQPIAGVNVVIKGSTIGTTTDASGRFSIEVDKKDILVFSFIGYAPKEVQVGNQTNIEVILLEDIQSLGEVVVNAGYWEVKEKEQTGSIARITSKEVEKQNVNNPLQALQGRLTGVYIEQNTGMPGGGFNILVRGQNSLRTGSGNTVNGNLPLYLIDGVPFTSTSLTSSSISSSNLKGGNPLSTINPGDIESIEVLKDADATAIYGSRGANGVILITTKKAKAGKASINFDFNQGFSQIGNTMDLLSTQQYVTMRKEAIKNDGLSDLIGDSEYDAYWPDLTLWDTARYTDWQKELIGNTGRITNAQLSISGGTHKTQFLFGGGYYRETTVFPGTNSFNRSTGKLQINHQSENSKFKISGSANYSASVSSIPSVDFTSLAVSLSPNAPSLYNENGDLNWEESTWSNPIALLRRKYSSSIENFVSNASLSYEVIEHLNLKSTMGFTSMTVDEISTNPLSAYDPNDLKGRTGSSSFGDSNLQTWIAEPQIDYFRTIANGVLTALVGTTFQQTVQSGKSIRATGYTNDALLENIDAATGIDVVNASYSQYRYSALFARINYNWREKYILNLTGRRDGSSRFGRGRRFANFGAIGAAWIFSNENFLQSLFPIISFGKLRTSYGSTGSDAIGNYQYLDTFSPTQYPYNGSTGLVLARLSNPDYSWEKNNKWEAAFELGLLENKIFLSAAHYINRSSGQLVGLPLPVMTGQSTVQFNLPAVVENKGWEFQVSSSNINSNRFQWTSSFNITIPANRLVKFPDIQNFPAYDSRYVVGKSLFIAKNFQFDQVDPETGLYAFIDLNGDDNISSTLDLVGRKEVTQQYYGGVGNTLKYKGLQLDFFFQYVKQTGYGYHRSFTMPGDLSNQPVEVMKRWQHPGEVTNVQKFSFADPDASVGTAFSRNLSSDNIISDASFIRLKTVSLSWQLPEKWSKKIKQASGRIYIQGQNLVTFTNYLGLDPENQNSQSLPPLRMLTVGLQVAF